MPFLILNNGHFAVWRLALERSCHGKHKQQLWRGIISGGAGYDALNSGAGVDAVICSGALADCSITPNGATCTIADVEARLARRH